MMNKMPAIKYQIAEHKKPVLMYYAITIGFICLIYLITVLLTEVSGPINFADFGMITAIFAFVIACVSFRDTFGMMLQNGISRRTFFVARLTSTALLAAVLTAVDHLVELLFVGVAFLQGYPSQLPGALALGSELLSFFCVQLACLAVGYTFSVLFYRVGRGVKIAVGVALPVLFITAITLVSIAYSEPLETLPPLYRFIRSVMDFCTAGPLNTMLVMVGTFLVFSGVSWLMIRRATVTQQ